MNKRLNQPNSFTQILDLTFRLGKEHFGKFFIILFIFMGPLFLLQALLELSYGMSLINFGTDDYGTGFLERMVSRFDGGMMVDSTADLFVGVEFVLVIVAILSVILMPIATVAITMAINHIRKNEEYTVGSVIKQAFSKILAIFGGSIVFGLIVFGVTIVSILLVMLAVFAVGGFDGNLISTVLILLVSIIGGGIGLGYFFTRIGFYLTAIAAGEKAPGIGVSWRLSKGRGWILLGLIIVFTIITTTVASAFELFFGLVFGNSVLYSLTSNLFSLITTLFMTIGYSVMYFDMKARNDADDLHDLIDEYDPR